MQNIHENSQQKGKCLQFCKNIIKSPQKKIIAFFDKIKNKKTQQQLAQNLDKNVNQMRGQKTQRNSDNLNNSSQNLKLFHNFLKKKQQTNIKDIDFKIQGFQTVGSQYGDHDYDDELQDFIKYPKGIKNKKTIKNTIEGSIKKIPIHFTNNFKSQISRSITAQAGSSDLNIQISKIKLKQYNKNAGKIQSQKSLFSKISQPFEQDSKLINENTETPKNQIKLSSRRKQPCYINSGYFKQIRNNFNFLKPKKLKTQISTPFTPKQFQEIIPKINAHEIYSRQHQRTKTQNNLQDVFQDYQKLKSYRKNQRKQLKLNQKELMISPQTKNCSRPFYNYQNESPRYSKTPNISEFGQKRSNLLFEKMKIQLSPKQRNQALSSMTSHQKNRKNQTQSINAIKQKFQQISESGNNHCGLNSPKNQTSYKNITYKGFGNLGNQIQKTRYSPLFQQAEDQYCEIKYNGIKFKAKIIKSNADALIKKFKNNKVKLLDKNFLSLQKMKKIRNVNNANN